LVLISHRCPESLPYVTCLCLATPAASHLHSRIESLSSDPQGGIVASMPAGSLFGVLAVGRLADTIRRRATIQLSSLFWVLGQSSSALQWYTPFVPSIANAIELFDYRTEEC